MQSKRVLVALAAGTLLAPVPTPRQEITPRLVQRATDVVGSGALRPFAGMTRRSGTLDIDLELLRDAGLVGREVSLDLFEDTSFRARFYRQDDDGYGPVWKAKLMGPLGGDVTLVGQGRRISGTIRHPYGRYHLVSTGPGRAVVHELDDASRRPDRVLVPPIARTGARRSGAAVTATSTVDVMVMFTAEAKKQEPPIAGGLKALIRIAVADMNTDLENGLIDMEIRLVKIKRVKYAKTGTSAAFAERALSDLRRSSDGHLDKAHRLRDRFGADFVALIIERNSAYCGIAFIGGGRSGLEDIDESGAFSVTTWRCLPFDTLAHEIGHNMGAQHSRLDPVSSSAGAYDYSYGHKVEGEIQTVMAYNCESLCVFANTFSNPNVLFGGVAAGVADGSAEPSDNARSFNNDRDVMAAYRPCAVRCE